MPKIRKILPVASGSMFYTKLDGGNAGSMLPSNSYLLDDYTAAAAYSLRQLKTGVTNVVRVRRSSDSTEADFTADEILDGTLTTWTGANDGFVVTWYDQANSNDVTQSTAADQPQIVSSGSVLTVNGKPALTFDGSNHRLVYGSAISALAETNDGSVVTVSAGHLAGDSGVLVSNSSGAPSTWLFIRHGNSDKTHFFVDGSVSGAVASSRSVTYSANDQVLNIGVKTAASNKVATFENGNTGTTANWSGTYTNSVLELGRRSNNNQHFDGDYQECVIFASDIEAAGDRTGIETNINNFYSIY
jgi:hypothetical protein